jgi:hypothetical protein
MGRNEAFLAAGEFFRAEREGRDLRMKMKWERAAPSAIAVFALLVIATALSFALWAGRMEDERRAQPSRARQGEMVP